MRKSVRRENKTLATLEAAATLMGVMIGAGILGLPYVVAKAGVLTGILTIIFVGLIMGLIYLYVGETTLRTKGRHQLTGYAGIYLGKNGKFLALVSMIIGDYGAIIAYSLGVSSTMTLLFGLTNISWLLLFFIFGGILIYKGVEIIKKYEFFLSALVIFMVIFILIMIYPNINIANIGYFDITKFYIPFGITLFAMLGFVAIPEMREELEQHEKQMKKAIIIGTIIPIVVYVIFSLVVALSIGIDNFELLGPNEKIATIALAKVLGSRMALLSNIFAILAMTTSFLAVGLALKEMFIYDYNFQKSTAWGLTILPPFFVSYFNLTNFMQVLNLSGIFAGGLMAILMLLTVRKAKLTGKRKPEYNIKLPLWLIIFLALIFVFGVINLLLF